MATLPLREFVYDKKGNVVNILPQGLNADTAARMTAMGPVAVSAKVAETLVGVPISVPESVLQHMEANAMQGQQPMVLTNHDSNPQYRSRVIVNAPMTAAIAPALRDKPFFVANPRHVNNLPLLQQNMNQDQSTGTSQIMAITMASPVFDIRKKRNSSTLVNSPSVLTPASFFDQLPGTVDLRGQSAEQIVRVLPTITNTPSDSRPLDPSSLNPIPLNPPLDIGAITTSTLEDQPPPTTGTLTRFYRRLRRSQYH